MATEVTETVGIVPVEESEDDNAADATGTESEGLVTGTESDEYADTTDPEFSDSDDDKKAVAAETSDDDEEADEWNEVVPPPKDDEYNGLVPPTPRIDSDSDEEEKKFELPYTERPPPSISSVGSKDEGPDFSSYKTNVAERLWRAKTEARKAGVKIAANLEPLARDYQQWRKKMGLLNKYLEEYQTAMEVVSEKRNKLVEHYASMSEDTPLWEHIGKPLTIYQMAEIEESGETKTLEGVELRTKAIAKVAEEIGPGTLMAHQQLAMMQDKLNRLEYQNHIVNYIDEWDKVVTSTLDAEIKEVREISKIKDHYVTKVDKLREKVNKIEHRGKQLAPRVLADQLERNEAKLASCDKLYEKKSNEISIELYEATKRGWVDFYPVMKNVMKFEVNRLGRESSTYGNFYSTLNALKTDYKEASKNTADAPRVGSAL
uniref:Uncharacterized protein n=1 Tax=Pseudo-nitzschia australis TaxID=44445 RepID=A0A7S4AAL4_9STRA|mmetsp:Transcript_13340/g.27955  ORF Transcript_13340/g.27955 Transcript_13340/m.27955 type:complete len:432 (-) Transcript_13340:140-1435(-)|eukprot:CAMPEP_0168203948 /NCGR_PEP_ID=MMETSP0139_2-20121125/25136_1 /TAXON_ID=44445 /ORGANISM="Pseudo-nitzschia australis, Strain 10249 10 AB" /LENGTH=431 /DNA_ID=CAMNT_0008129853 /DNA_START=176 /DNA_END=1471 /DNA_ORIENTATION=+